MKKLLVIPIMLMYYLLILITFPIHIVLIIVNRFATWLNDTTNDLSCYYEDYCRKPFARIYTYALDIMESDKIIKRMQEASNKLKQGKPID